METQINKTNAGRTGAIIIDGVKVLEATYKNIYEEDN